MMATGIDDVLPIKRVGGMRCDLHNRRGAVIVFLSGFQFIHSWPPRQMKMRTEQMIYRDLTGNRVDLCAIRCCIAISWSVNSHSPSRAITESDTVHQETSSAQIWTLCNFSAISSSSSVGVIAF